MGFPALLINYFLAQGGDDLVGSVEATECIGADAVDVAAD